MKARPAIHLLRHCYSGGHAPACGATSTMLAEQLEDVTCGLCRRYATNPAFMARLARDAEQERERQAEAARQAEEARARKERKPSPSPAVKAYFDDLHEWDRIGIELRRADPKRYAELLEIGRKYAAVYARGGDTTGLGREVRAALAPAPEELN